MFKILRKKLTKGIRFKISLVFTLTFSCIFFGGTAFIYFKIKDMLVQADNTALLARAEVLLGRTEIDPVIVPIPTRGEEVKIEFEDEAYIETIFASRRFPQVADTLSQKGVVDMDGWRIATAENVVDSYNGDLIRLSVARSGGLLYGTLQSLVYFLIFINLMGVVLATVLSYWLAGFILQPLSNIINKAKNINATSKMEFVEVPASNDELQNLAETLNEMLARIEKAMETQSNFFASAAHELRTPLSIIRTSLDVTLRDGKQTEESIRFLKVQKEELERLSQLVEDFLLVSLMKKQAGNTARFSIFSLDDLALDLASKFNKRLLEAGLQLKISLDTSADHFIVNADKDKITHVLINLLENAIKYAVSPGDICLHIEKFEKVVKLVIKNKTRMQIQDPELLLAEYYQADILKDGFGLGLWISNKIMELHGEKLYINQQNEVFTASFTLH